MCINPTHQASLPGTHGKRTLLVSSRNMEKQMIVMLTVVMVVLKYLGDAFLILFLEEIMKRVKVKELTEGIMLMLCIGRG